MTEILGGSYDEVKKSNKEPNEEYRKSHDTHKYEAHHVWAYGSYKDISQPKLTKEEGPSIRMEKEEHRFTASHNSNPGFKNFQKQQSELLEKGEYKKAWEMGVNDVRKAGIKNGKPENTYDKHINQAEKQVLKLHEQGKIKLDNNFKSKLEQRQPKVEKKLENTQTQKSVFSNNQNLLSQQQDRGRGR